MRGSRSSSRLCRRNPNEQSRFKATVDIMTLTISSGQLPRRAQELVLDWAELHQKELLEDWHLCMDKQQPKQIEPLK